jgi:hypothetical protein
MLAVLMSNSRPPRCRLPVPGERRLSGRDSAAAVGCRYRARGGQMAGTELQLSAASTGREATKWPGQRCSCRLPVPGDRRSSGRESAAAVGCRYRARGGKVAGTELQLSAADTGREAAKWPGQRCSCRPDCRHVRRLGKNLTVADRVSVAFSSGTILWMGMCLVTWCVTPRH